MYDVIFSREEFDDGTVLYNVDVEDRQTKEILFSVPVSFDTVEQAELYVKSEIDSYYEDARWVYVFLSSDDYIEA